jgi:hypothetical protein
MRSWKLWLSALAVLAACSDEKGGLPGPTELVPDAALDSKPTVEDSPMATEIGGGADGASATGGVAGSGGGVGTGGALGTGGAGHVDAAAAIYDAGALASGGWLGGTGSSGGNWGMGGASTSATSGPGGGTGGIIGSGGAGGTAAGGTPGLDGGALSLLDLVPRSNSVPGWTVDPSYPVTAGRIAAVATTQTETENLIDGAAEDFFAGPAMPTMFAWQNYVNASLPSPGSEPDGSRLSLYLLELPSAEEAIKLYLSLPQSTLYASNTWTDPTSPPIGTRSRVTDSGTDWWINFCKGYYYVEVRLTPSYGPAPDYAPGSATQKQAALDFAAAVAAKM